MPRNSSGVYSPPAGTAAVSMQPMSSAAYNAYIADNAAEITNSLPTTGVKAMGANLPMGGNKIVNMADPSVLTDATTKNYVDNITHGKIVSLQILTVTGTYTKSTNATTIDIYLVGGGGGGGGAPATGAGQVSLGGGAGGGAFTFKKGIAAPASCSFTIGAGGAGVVGGNGNAGGQTIFNTTYTANGGAGGIAAGPSSGNFLVSPVAGGAAGATGDVNSAGNPGNFGINTNSGLSGGLGAPSLFWGWGGRGAGCSIGRQFRCHRWRGRPQGRHPRCGVHIMAYLLVENGIVVNSIVGPEGEWTPPAGQQLIQADGNIGDSWDGTKIIPAQAPPPAPPNTFTPRAFIETLFTPAEQQAIFTAAQQPPGWQISMFIALVSGTPAIDLTNPELIKDIGVVQAAGILTAARAAQILAGTPV